MYTIVGLGNPGEKYKDTRHNAGRLVLLDFLETQHFPSLVSSSKFAADISEGRVGNHEVCVAFPHTYMNKSGSSVKKLVSQKEDIEHMILISDDLDLPLGDFKISFGKGSGGHNGVQSVIDAVDSKNFVRIRVGISPVSLFGHMKKPSGVDRVSRFVTQPFSKRERTKIDAIAPDVTRAILTTITEGREAAMSTCQP